MKTTTNGWEADQLGNLVIFKTGKLNSNAAVKNGAYPFFTCSQETFRTNTFAFDTECVLLAGNNANGIYPLKYFHGRFDAYQRTYIITPKDRNWLNTRFFYYAMRPLLEHLRSISTGVATKFLTLTILSGLRLTYPSESTQRKIAGILSAYDDLIENNTRRIALLEEMAQAIYREWFVHFRFPGHEHAKLVDSPLGKIPDGWHLHQLNTVCSRITDGSHRSPKSVDVGLPMASMKDMDDWGLDFSGCRYISQDDFNELVRNDCKPKVGDVLVAKDGVSYLKYIFVVEKELEVVLLSSIAVLRPSGELLPHLMSFILRDPSIKGRLANCVTGAAIPRVILKDFSRFEIVVPHKAIQDKWWSITSPIVGLIHRLRDKIDNLRTTRDLLLPKLISGQLDVEDLDIETSEPLLEAVA